MKIGIGCGVDAAKVVRSAGDAASPDTEIICYAKTGEELPAPAKGVTLLFSDAPEKALIDDLHAGNIQAAVRGSLPANDTLQYLKSVYAVPRLERIALLETAAGQKFFFAPVGVDEGWTVAEKVSFALNRSLPEDIVIQKSEEVPQDFHPRFCDSTKTYEYRIWNATFVQPVNRLYTYHVHDALDVEAMQRAAQFIVGEHDFASFCSVGAQVQ